MLLENTAPTASDRTLRLCTILGALGAWALLLLLPAAASAQATFSTLFTLTSCPPGSTDVTLSPEGPDLTARDANGNLVGTTFCGNYSSGGNGGTLFKLASDGTFTNSYVFTGGADGWFPSGGGLSIGTDGTIYGTTTYGGTTTVSDIAGGGTVYKLTAGGTFTTLYSFVCGSTAGCHPGAVRPTSDGNFIGMSNAIGGNAGGTVFKITPTGTLTTLYTFTGGADGIGGGLIIQGSDGNFYGMTEVIPSGSGSGGSGAPSIPAVFFRLTSGGSFTALYTFTGGADGGFPSSLFEASDGNFYGTTDYGGANGQGTIFKLTTSGTLATLYSFPTSSDSLDKGMILGRDGNFYGVTFCGVALTGCEGSFGSVFMMTSSGTLTTLYSFTGGADGAAPVGLIQGTDGNIYGSTLANTPGSALPSPASAAVLNGTIFKIALASAQKAPTVTLSANPSSVTAGDSITLTWSSTDATSCTASGAWNGTQLTSGSVSETLSATGTATYTLNCSGAEGNATGTATVTVASASPPAAPTVTISASPTSTTLGGSTTLTWSSTNTTSCTGSGGWSGGEPTSGNAQETPTATRTATYTLTCAGAGGSANAVVSVSVAASGAPSSSPKGGGARWELM